MSANRKGRRLFGVSEITRLVGAVALAGLSCAAGVGATRQSPSGGRPDLTVSINQVGNSTVTSLTTTTYTLTILNGGGAAASNVRVQVTFPGKGWAPPSDGSVGGGCSFLEQLLRGPGDIVTCDGINVPAGGFKAVTIRVRSATFAGVANTANFTIVAEVDPANVIPESNENNNRAQVTTVIERLPELSPDATGLPLTSTETELTYPIKIRNTGDGTATNMVTRISLPREVDFVRADTSQLGPCAVSGPAGPQDGQKVTCTLPLMQPNSDASVRIVTRLVHGLANGAQIFLSFIVDPDNGIRERNEGNNTAGVVTKVNLPTDLEITTITIERTGLPVTSLEIAGVRVNPFAPGAEVCTADGTSRANTRVRVRVVNHGPGQSLPTTLRLFWIERVTPDTRTDCVAGNHCVNGSCVAGQANTGPPSCFDTCDVLALLPEHAEEIVLYVIRSTDIDQLGIALVDPLLRANDPNRANNSKPIR